jgi:uncharacterized protein involved in tellurium resistance
MKERLNRGDNVLIDTPWKKDVLATVLCVNSKEEEHSLWHITDTAVLYGDNSVFTIEYHGTRKWTKTNGAVTMSWEITAPKIKLLLDSEIKSELDTIHNTIIK